MAIDLSTTIGKIKLKNPVMVSSGTFGYGKEYEELVDINKLGAIVTKSITCKPKEGNKPPRLKETASGLINSIGLENVGLKTFIKEKLPFLKKLNTKVIVSIAAEKKEDFYYLAKELSSYDIDAIELNISCPNVESNGGLTFAQDEKMVEEIVSKVRSLTDLTLITKLSPNVTDIVKIAKQAESSGSDAVSLVNTFLSLAVDAKTRKPVLGNITGGLSGPAIKPMALRMVYQVAKEIDIDIIGQGGIMTPQDALEFLICGANAVSLGTANFINPKAPIEVIEGIKKYLKEEKFNNLNELIGSLKIEG
jgi:dihydroorotate dehydrogenase (NAD+) catalytic subunit